MKTVLAVGDIHGGHLLGLTPPDYQHRALPGGNSMRDRAAKVQASMWDWFDRSLDQIGDIDLLIENADAVDGTGRRSGGTEQITTDMNVQVDIAIDVLERIGCRKMAATFGTPYHTGDTEDWETTLVSRLTDKAWDVHIDNYLYLDVDGCVFDVKHKVGRSTIPHGRHTAMAKENMWNELESAHGIKPRANVILRSHVHYFTYCGGPGWLAMTLPALQAAGTKFGARQNSGTIDIGMVVFHVDGPDVPAWEAYLWEAEDQKASMLKYTDSGLTYVDW